MSHYFESGFFVRKGAWHGLGVTLENAPNTREAVALAGLDWTVETVPVFAAPGVVDKDDANAPIGVGANTSELLPATDARAMVRHVHQPDGDIETDVLGIVGTRYVPLQNVDAFRWFDPLVADGSCALEAAGSVRGGRNVWVLAKINDATATVGRNREDVVAPYLLLSNSHDGTRAVTCAFTPIRVVCWNTLSAAHSAADAKGSGARKVRHTASMDTTLKNVRDSIDLARRDFSSRAELWRKLASIDLDAVPALYSEGVRGANRRAATTLAYARKVFGNPAKVKDALEKGEELPEVRAEQHLWRLLHQGPGADSAGITPFGLYMAATHYDQHQNGHNADTRLASTWFGAGRTLAERAEAEALAMMP